MKTMICEVSNIPLSEVIRRSEVADKPDAEAILRRMIYRSTEVRYGFIDGELACLWGMICPTLLSDDAYFWLLTTDVVKEHTFAFIRASQRYVESALKRYPIIVGDADVENVKAQRWLRWLGAEFQLPVGNRLPFTIRRVPHG